MKIINSLHLILDAEHIQLLIVDANDWAFFIFFLTTYHRMKTEIKKNN